MINFLKGVIIDQKGDILTLNIAGFGLQVHVPENIIAITGQEMQLWSYMHWNQENGPSLFGFTESSQRELFCLLISVSGIGPRMALALLSAFSVNTLIDALICGNISLLSSVSGIGRKKAELLILSLKDKVQKVTLSYTASTENAGFSAHLKDLSDALTSLGYTRQEIIAAIDQLRAADGAPTFVFDQLLRKSLQILAKK